MKAALKRWRWARKQRDLEASLFCMGGYGAWQRVKGVNDVTGVWRGQRRRNAVRVAALTLVPLAYLVACGFLLTGCSSGPDQAACKGALVQQWRQALGNPTTVSPGTEPQACKGLDAATLQRLWAQAGNEAAG
jgi:hypothetical protein